MRDVFYVVKFARDAQIWRYNNYIKRRFGFGELAAPFDKLRAIGAQSTQSRIWLGRGGFETRPLGFGISKKLRASREGLHFPGICIADDLNYMNVLNGLNAFDAYTRKNFFAFRPSTLAFSSKVKSGRSIVL